MGKMVQVEVTSAGEHFQMARVLRETQVHSPGLVEPLPKGAVSGVKTQDTSGTMAHVKANPWNRWKNGALVVLIVAVLIRVLRLLYLWTRG